MSKRRTVNGALLGIPEAAAYLGMTERATRWYVEQGLIPYRRLGGRIVFKRSELESFVDDLPGVTLAQARRAANARKQ